MQGPKNRQTCSATRHFEGRIGLSGKDIAEKCRFTYIGISFALLGRLVFVFRGSAAEFIGHSCGLHVSFLCPVHDVGLVCGLGGRFRRLKTETFRGSPRQA